MDGNPPKPEPTAALATGINLGGQGEQIVAEINIVYTDAKQLLVKTSGGLDPRQYVKMMLDAAKAYLSQNLEPKQPDLVQPVRSLPPGLKAVQ